MTLKVLKFAGEDGVVVDFENKVLEMMNFFSFPKLEPVAQRQEMVSGTLALLINIVETVWK